jgi:O-antigen/teichoic acid export membrane protein
MSGFARSVLTLGSGNVIAQAISVLAVPVLTRIYDAAEFGAFSFVFAVVAVAYPAATLRFNSAILLPREEDQADALLFLAAFSVVAVSVLVMPALALGLDRFLPLDGATRAVLWFLAVGVLLHGLVQCLEFWLLRHRQYRALALGTIGESVTDRGVAIVMGLAQPATATWLVLGRVAGALVHGLVFLTAAASARRLPAAPAARLPRLREVAGRYRSFPLYSTVALLFANGGRELPTLVLGGMFSATVAGMYALGMRVLGFPSMLLGDAVAKAFFRHATALRDEPARLGEATRLLVRGSIYLMLPPMLLLCVAGPALFRVVFGAEWVAAGHFAQVLALSFLVTFLYRVLGVFFDIADRQPMRLLFDAAQFVGRIGAMVAGGLAWGVEGALWGLLLATVVVQGAAIVYLLSLAGLAAGATGALLGGAALNLAPLAAGLAGLAAAGPTPLGGALALAGLLAQVPWLLRREVALAGLARRWAT